MSFDGLNFSKNLPATPGVYKMYADEKLLYIGKAKNLQKRVHSYFSRPLDNRLTRMVGQITHINTVSVPTEIDALLLESDLIKKENPKYNILLKDDRGYPYIYVSTDIEFPRIEIHYQKNSKNKGRYFGPYPSRKDVREAVSSLQDHFKLRTCDDAFFKNRAHPCFQFQIKKCSAPCVLEIAKENYKSQVKELCAVLDGRGQEMINTFVEKMKKSSELGDYEKAIEYRDTITSIRHVQSQITVDSGGDDYECVHIETKGFFGVGVVLFVRNGKITATDHVPFDIPFHETSEDDFSMQEIFFARFLSKNPPLSQHMVVLEQDHKDIEKVLRHFEINTSVSHPKNQAQKNHLSISRQTVKTTLLSMAADTDKKIHQFADVGVILGLKKSPEKIECFDISHIQGQDTVGSKVAFGLNGPIKNEYRRYSLQETNGDDLLAMRKTLERRFAKAENLPDLLLIDGGHNQVNVAKDVLQAAGLSLICVGISKGPDRIEGEEVLILAETGEEISPAKNSPGFHLLQTVRNEAHRFAIEGHRKKRSKRMVSSALDDVEGVGKSRRKKLLQFFGGLEQLKLASVEQIAAVPGVGKKVGEKIFHLFHSDKT